MPAQWLIQSSEVSGRVGAALTSAFTALAQPARARRLRMVLFALLALWAVLALSKLVWALLPAAESAAQTPDSVINAVSLSPADARVEPVDVNRMVAWHLFGRAGAPDQVVMELEPTATPNAREGIEDGARETRLQLKLRGIVASTQDGLGHAIIEHKSKQAIYAVEDKLPLSGKVVLAKVMPRQIVLDNGGTYELLVLYDESKLDTVGMSAPATKPNPSKEPQVDRRSDAKTTDLALSYRERLYENPQSLVEVVNVSAVRDGGTLSGYKVNPGKDREQFEQLGFKPGDLVTTINGVSLDNPANTMVLYNSMRTAGEVVIELERQGQPMTLSVNLDSGAVQ